MDEKRIYQKKINVQTEYVRDFYNQRAKSVADRPEAYTTVLLGDGNPQYAKQWDAYEKEYILPKLQLTGTKNVLDIGCGMGRWTKSTAPLCNQYVGVDFSPDMIHLAQKQFSRPPYDKCSFFNLSFDEAMHDERILGMSFGAVIIAGVSMYVNDEMLRKCYDSLKNVLSGGAVVYIEESAAVKDRLTLNHIWSDVLQSDYDAIYRTREEYLDLLKPLLQDCIILEEGYMNPLDKKEFTDTTHWYAVLRYAVQDS